MSDNDILTPWDTYVKERGWSQITDLKYCSTNIACPVCGKRIMRRMDVVLTSNPPKSVYKCFSCNWSGTA